MFSLPLLFTMEIWEAGFSISSLGLVGCMMVTFLLLLGYNRFAGLRPTATWKEVVIDSVEEMGIGFVISFLVLLMLRRIDLEAMSLQEIMGKTILEAMTVAIGVSVGTAQLGIVEPEEGETERDTFSGQNDKDAGDASFMSQIVLAICGGILVGGNIAPTEEIEIIAMEATGIHAIVMVVFSLLVSSVILFFSDFKGTGDSENGEFDYRIIIGTCICYTLAFLISALILWFFGRFDGLGFNMIIKECIVLSVPTVLGASAGSLLIK